MGLNLENRVLLSLVAKSSFGKDVPFLKDEESLEDINWLQVYRESVQQAVPLFVLSALSDYRKYIPKNIFNEWFSLSGKAFTLNSFVANYQNELVKFLDDNQYKYVILKGFASASYYENPDMRMLGDVDFLVNSEKFQEIAEKIQKELNYNLSTNLEHNYHISMAKGRAKIEMHYEIAGIPNGAKGEYIKEYIKEILENTQYVQLNDCKFTAPSHLFHGIVILLHTLHHMTGDGLGLRHLCDWGAFVNKTAKMDFWADDLMPFLKKIGLYKFTNVITSVCQKYLNIDMPDSLITEDNELCEEIICDILKSGNLGAKNEQYHDSRLLISDDGEQKMNTISTLTGKLDLAVKSHWPWLKKWKIFLPIAYLFFVLKYYFRVFKGERPTLNSLIPEANRRKILYKKLDIYEDSK